MEEEGMVEVVVVEGVDKSIKREGGVFFLLSFFPLARKKEIDFVRV